MIWDPLGYFSLYMWPMNEGMSHEEMIARLREKFMVLDAVLDERGRRLWAVTEAKALGYGGQTLVAKATGLSRRTLYQGLRELEPLSGGHHAATRRVRRPGGGRQAPDVSRSDAVGRPGSSGRADQPGGPESPVRWTCKSVRQLAAALQRQGHQVGRHKVAELRAALAYSLQGTRKTKAGTAHPDRHAPCAHITAQVAACHKRGQPVVAVDTKKKALVGDCQIGPRGTHRAPALVRTYDFADKTLGKVHPYGVYDQTAKVGWVRVGGDHDTAELAVESLQRWGTKRGSCRYQDATALLITADGGGRNGRRSRLWKVALQRLAAATGVRIAVCHVPPGTSTWHKSERPDVQSYPHALAGPAGDEP